MIVVFILLAHASKIEMIRWTKIKQIIYLNKLFVDFRQRRVNAHAQRGQNITPHAGNVYSVYYER